MFKRIGNVFFIISISVGFGLLKNILLGRQLTKEDLGLFSLLMTIVGLVYPMVLMGQQTTLLRVFSKDSPSDYNWPLFLKKLLFFSIILSLIISLICQFLFTFSVLITSFLFIVIISSFTSELYSYMLRAIGKYERAILIHRSIRVAFPLILIIVLLFGRFILSVVLISFGILYILHAVVAFILAHRLLEHGSKQIPFERCKEGFYILLSDLSLLVVVSIDKIFLAKFVNYEDVGIYFAIYSLMRLFELSFQAIDYVLIPHSNRKENLKISNISLKIALLGGLITLGYIVFGEYLVHLVYSGKFDNSYHLIYYFCVIGFIRLMCVVPSSIISGKLKTDALKMNMFFNFVLILINIILVYWFIMNWGIQGALVATGIIWLIRTSIAYGILMKFYKKTNIPELNLKIQT